MREERGAAALEDNIWEESGEESGCAEEAGECAKGATAAAAAPPAAATPRAPAPAPAAASGERILVTQDTLGESRASPMPALSALLLLLLLPLLESGEGNGFGLGELNAEDTEGRGG